MYVCFFKKRDLSSQTTYREEKQPFAWSSGGARIRVEGGQNLYKIYEF